ncbi:MAG: hypothetical protein ABJG86_16490 [Nitratireductor sp.]
MMKIFSPMLAAVIGFAATPALAGPLLENGQTVVASFSTGNLKGQTFRLRYNEKKNMLKDRPVTQHTKSMVSIKTPGGWCKFASSGKVQCHNGTGTWTAR